MTFYKFTFDAEMFVPTGELDAPTTGLVSLAAVGVSALFADAGVALFRKKIIS